MRQAALPGALCFQIRLSDMTTQIYRYSALKLNSSMVQFVVVRVGNP